MAQLPIDIVGNGNDSGIEGFDSERFINVYPIFDADGKNGKGIFQTPGLNEVLTLGSSTIGVRALWVFNNKLYAVIGDTFYEISSTFNYSSQGILNTSSGFVKIKDNGTQVMLVDGVNGYVYEPSATTTFSTITDPDFPLSPKTLNVFGERFVVNVGDVGDQNQYAISDIKDGTSWNALNRAGITYQPDTLEAIAVVSGRMFLLGKRSGETWYDSGAQDFPFERDNSLLLNLGIASTGSLAEDFGISIWLSRNEQGASSVVMTDGAAPKPISTKKVEKAFDSYSDVSDARSFIYKNENGHIFYQINFTAANKSWAYDVSTNRWVELDYKTRTRHLAENHAFLNQKHYVGDYGAAIIYELSDEFNSDNGIAIRRKVRTKIHEAPNYNEVTINKLHVEMMQGVGSTTGLDEDPKLFLMVSYDGGLCFGNQIYANIGKQGFNRRQTTFYRLGQATSFVFDFEYYNQRKFALYGASIEFFSSPTGV